MPSRRFELTFPEGLWERIEAERGHEPRASFIKRTLESALGDFYREPSGPSSVPAQSRASSAAPKSESAAAPPVASASEVGMRTADCGCSVLASSSLKRCVPHGRPFR